ncbi:MAG: ABC transporter substrate-binding protein [Proteobacteria bacterium]|jgi:microcin C transport system substrate-binding protein|nr:extracellular solute-binding protein [Alphaproteobacteria bacterium]NCC02828.1 ABC transporter substrate-binding protein [Pseudomonadota bacterium]
MRNALLLKLAFLLAFFFSMPTLCYATSHTSYGIAMRAAPKYPGYFNHFDYVNPYAPKGGTLRMGDVGTFDSVNPFILKGVPAALSSMVFSTLMEGSLDEPFSQYGLIAKDVTIGDSNSWVSYNLRPEAKFNDGKPITADDVIFSFETLRDKGHPAYRSYYKDVDHAEKMSDHAVKFVFRTTGNAELPLIMGQLPVLPKHFWKNKNFAATTLSPILGSGPYKIESISPGRGIIYSRVDNWWGKDIPVNKGRYNFDKISVEYYRDATVAIEAFLANRYDVRVENIAKEWATAYNTPAVKQGLIKKIQIKNESPSGMQGFVFNLRNPLFQDRRVRQALTLAFDFEWGNKTLAYGAYQRTNSYFANSELAARGTPSGAEYDFLWPYREQLPREVFSSVYEPPRTDGSGNNRDNLRMAANLLAQAGWKMANGKLVNAQGEPFSFEIIDKSPLFERWVAPFIRNLERLGITANYRVVDSAQYQNMMDSFNFDMTPHVFGQSLSPGNEQRDFWTSAKATQNGSRNLIGLQDPVVDELVEKIVHARSRAELVTLTRALDRVLLWGYYVIPHWNIGYYRIAYWDQLSKPDKDPPYGADIVSLWWFDADKKAKLDAASQKGKK